MGRLLFFALLGVAAYYAVFGGEYSLLEVRQIRLDTEAAQITLAELRSEADSLDLWADVLENDPKTLETLARERFGMIREGEVLYRFADDGGDSDPNTDEDQPSR